MKQLKRVFAVCMMVVIFFGCGIVPGKAEAAVKLSETNLSIEVGDQITLQVTGTKKKVKWSTTDKTVASVTKKGEVTAVSEGSAVIKAKVGKKTLKCNVTVNAKPLTGYWTEGSTVAEDLRAYVKKVTDPADTENFIPAKDRIAVFDMDGTLICETYFTYFDSVMFKHFCLIDHPEKVTDELKEAAKAVKVGYTAGEELARNFAKAYAGMTLQELYDYAIEFGQKYTESFNNMRYIDCFYLPMVEVVEYLYNNDFEVYVVTGTEVTTARAVVANSPIKDYVSPSHVIGTEFEVKLKGNENTSSNMDYKYADADEMVFTGDFVQKNLNANKVLWIERNIGQRPVLAFGNSGSDTSMMNYVLDKRNPYPSEAFMVVADDAEREWGKQSWEEKSAEYKAFGYVPVSMKNDFALIYPENVTRAEQQYVEPTGLVGIGDAAAALDDAA